MSSNRGKEGRARKGRSAEQRQGSAALIWVMRVWEELSDEERLTWRVQGKHQRTNGISYFKHINLRRARRGQELARLPPPFKAYDARPILKRLDIRNRGGWVTLNLELRQKPVVPTTVWGARPCNRGLEKPAKCPRLGWLPAPKGGASEITELYFQKHGEGIRRHRMQLAGKRIFIRIRREVDGGPVLYEEVNAVVPAP